MIEGVDFTVSYAPVVDIKYLRINIAISYTEVRIIFILGIYNVFQNTIIPYLKEIDYLSLPHLYL